MAKKYILNLTDSERAALTEVASKQRVSALKRQRAQIVLKSDEGLMDTEIADDLDVDVRTVERVRQRAVLEGLEAALERKKQLRPSRPRKLDGRAEAHLVQLACSNPPEGQVRWTLRLLADRMVELKIVDQLSTPTVHRGLKKTSSSPGR